MRLRDSRLSRLQGHHRRKPALGNIAQYHGPAMRLNDGPGDGEAQADAAFIAAAGSFKAHEGFKHRLKLIVGQFQPLVCDGDDGHSRCPVQRRQGHAAILNRSVD